MFKAIRLTDSGRAFFNNLFVFYSIFKRESNVPRSLVFYLLIILNKDILSKSLICVISVNDMVLMSCKLVFNNNINFIVTRFYIIYN